MRQRPAGQLSPRINGGTGGGGGRPRSGPAGACGGSRRTKGRRSGRTMRAELGGPRAGSAPRSGAWAGGDERPLVAERGTPLPCEGTPPPLLSLHNAVRKAP